MNWFKKLFINTCPNCDSAYSGGNPNPEERTWCIICSHPETGKIRGWVWRWTWFHRWLVARHNFAHLAVHMDLKKEEARRVLPR